MLRDLLRLWLEREPVVVQLWARGRIYRAIYEEIVVLGLCRSGALFDPLWAEISTFTFTFTFTFTVTFQMLFWLASKPCAAVPVLLP